jgi:hypothetical protein
MKLGIPMAAQRCFCLVEQRWDFIISELSWNYSIKACYPESSVASLLAL